MLEIDGSEGGGQILRTSLALSAVTNRPITVTGIRGNRPEPGLKPQHLTGVETIAEICSAETDGVEAGAEALEFRPGSPAGGNYEAAIGTAGAVTLLFDTVLPLAATLERPLTLTATGGTEVKWAPPLSTYRAVKLALCRQFGLQAFVSRQRTGFYPAGGGAATLWLAPSRLQELSYTGRGDLLGVDVYSRESRGLADSDVARRQATTARDLLGDADLSVREEVLATAETKSPGSAITIAFEYEHTAAGFNALGEPGTPAEAVAENPARRAIQFHEGSAPLDRHHADQLLVFLALAGGSIVVPERTDHVDSSLDLLDTFGSEPTVESVEAGQSVTVTDPIEHRC